MCVKYLREHTVAEITGLALLGAAVSVPVAMLCVALSQKVAIWILDEEIRREMEKAREAREEMYQQRLTRFLEDCIEEEGDTPVWKSGRKR